MQISQGCLVSGDPKTQGTDWKFDAKHEEIFATNPFPLLSEISSNLFIDLSTRCYTKEGNDLRI